MQRFRTFFSFLTISLFLLSCNKSSTTTNLIANSETSNWMHIILVAHPDSNIALIDLAVPGSHDAGTYLFTDCKPGANTCNTQTQLLNTTQQLIAGLRIFDIRPSYFNNKYYTQHATDCDGYGCKGDLLSNMFFQINQFLEQHAEFVIIELSHFCHTSYNDPGFTALINNSFGNKIYKEPVPETVPFIKKALKDIIPINKKSGKVLIIYDDGVNDNPSNRANGIFTNVIIPVEGGWGNSHDFADLKQKQLNNYTNYSNNGTTLFQFSWQITQSDQMAVDCAVFPDTASIIILADRANAQLIPIFDSLITNGQIRKGRIPNVIFVDHADEFITKQCIRINKLNLE